MSENNGNGAAALLTPEQKEDYYQMLRELVKDEQAGVGMVFAEGENPYEGDWDPNFKWPEEAGVQVGDRWVPDSLGAEVASATLVLAKQGKHGQPLRASMKRQKFSGDAVQQMRETAKWGNLREDYLGFPDPFAYGSQQAVSGIGGVLNQYVPLWPGPVTRQLYWQDYWQMSAKAFEAYNHDPISWRCIHMKAEFTLGRGLACKVTYDSGSDKKGQRHEQAWIAWMDFWKRNKMDQRLDTFVRDYCWGGEQFMRYFKSGKQLTVRSLDPATIYDLITDPEDIETVFAYHQQFQTAYQLYPPKQGKPTGQAPAPTGSSTPGSSVKYVIRQILPQEVDHYKANASAYERRGRSDLYPALGWIKRLRDYLTSHVIRADMLARICWDLEVAGNQSAIQNLRGQLFPGGRPPAPGTVFGHNSASKLNALAPEAGSRGNSQGDPILDALVTMTALSAGLPKDWLGFGMQNTRAGALVATEPGAKALEDLQGAVEQVIQDQFERVMKAAGINNATLEVTFPSLASEERQQKLDDLGTMEGMGWLSKKTAATMAAREMGITTYDFEAEEQLIAGEYPAGETDSDGKPKQGDGKIRRQVILATKRQAAKIDVTKAPSEFEDLPGETLTYKEGGPGGGDDGGDLPAPGSPDGTGRTVAGGGSHKHGVTRGGAPADENPMGGAGAQSIRKDNTKITMQEGAVTLPAQEFRRLVEGRAVPRRRPDDPEFAQAEQTYREQSAANLVELAQSALEARRVQEAEQQRLREEVEKERRFSRRIVNTLFGRQASQTDPETPTDEPQ